MNMIYKQFSKTRTKL